MPADFTLRLHLFNVLLGVATHLCDFFVLFLLWFVQFSASCYSSNLFALRLLAVRRGGGGDGGGGVAEIN